MTAIKDALEPAAVANEYDLDFQVRISQAISLKRIADALDKHADLGNDFSNDFASAPQPATPAETK